MRNRISRRIQEGAVKRRVLFLIFAGCLSAAAGLVFIQGCTNQVPTIAAALGSVPTPLPSDFVSNFENGSVTVNPNLQGYPPVIPTNPVSQLVPNGSPAFKPGVWVLTTYGGPPGASNAVNSPFIVPNTVGDSVDSSSYAIHVGPTTLIAAGKYESDQLLCHLVTTPSNPYFDASAFNGIQFYYKIQSAASASVTDNNNHRIVQIAIDQTLPPDGGAGGTCSYGDNNCFNHFQIQLPGGSTTTAGVDQWVVATYNWSAFSVPYGTSQLSDQPTPHLSNHLNKFLFIQWQFSDNMQGSLAAPVTTETNFWIDNVQFLP